MLEVTEWVRPNGSRRKRQIATDCKEFFEKNNIRVEMEYDRRGHVAFYLQMRDHLDEMGEPTELVRVFDEEAPLTASLKNCEAFASQWLKSTEKQ